MAGYISSNRAKINRILPKLEKSLKVTTGFKYSSSSLNITITHNGRIDGIDSVLFFEVTVDLLEDTEMENFTSFFKNHSLSIRLHLKSKKESHESSIWHLDTENKRFNLMHPKYHFQYGGLLAKELGRKCYNPPRLASLPFDYLAAIDFFVCNFFDEEKAQLFRKEPEYLNALRISQRSILKGYHDLVHRYFVNEVDDDEKSIVKKLIPAIISANQLVSK